MFLPALAGALAGTLAGPRIVALFGGAPDWVMPAVLAVSVMLALLAAYVAFHLATGRRRVQLVELAVGPDTASKPTPHSAKA
ncbi:hypothetical protein [Lysobacter sp. A3-1-A15]|uniref:hypothetical protein n=1 Tax=Novilysobacter viscosus TaxID=3098602 RepID=UPI002EDAC85F